MAEGAKALYGSIIGKGGASGGGGGGGTLAHFCYDISDFTWAWANYMYTAVCEDGMTWGEFVASDYNPPCYYSYQQETTPTFSILGGSVYVSFAGAYGDAVEYLTVPLYGNGDSVSEEDTIVLESPNFYGAMFGSDCMRSDTIISAPKKDIEVKDIQKGDKVETLDPVTLEIKSAEVLKVKRDIINPEYLYSDGWWKYTFDDGNEIHLAGRGQHRFFDCDTMKFEWMYDFKVGHHAYRKDGTTPKLVKVEHFDERIVYNTFWNENHENYFADGFLSGNADTPIPNFTFDFTEEK